MKVGYLGPEGSYSEIAARKFKSGATLVGYPSFPALFAALHEGQTDYAAVPIENSLNGGVMQNIDLLQSYEDIVAIQETEVHIEHRLAVLKGADFSKITRIYSHQQALAQCALFLAANYPKAELIATPSTAASLKFLKCNTDACIVGSHTALPGLCYSQGNIADYSVNITTFLLLKKGSPNPVSKKIFFSATCRHRPGELLSLLSIIKEGGLNMTKIESRPIKDIPGEYRFFIELEGDISNENTIQVLNLIKKAANSFKILGTY